MTFQWVCAVDDLWEGEMASFEISGRTVLAVNVDGEIRAYQGICPHQNVALAEGSLDGYVLTCRAHLWQFDVRTGAGVNPASARLQRFPVKLVDREVFVGDAETPTASDQPKGRRESA